jgi:hypothetical protein
MKDFFRVKKNDANILNIEISIVKISNYLSAIYEDNRDVNVTITYRKSNYGNCQLHVCFFHEDGQVGGNIYIHKHDAIDIMFKKIEIIEQFMLGDLNINQIIAFIDNNKSDFY